MVDITDLTALGVFIGIFIPLMSAILQYRQSVKQEYEKSFRAIVEKLSAGKKEERVAAASSLGTFIRKSGFIRKRGQFYDESIDVLVNTISIELDHNVLNAIRGSLREIHVLAGEKSVKISLDKNKEKAVLKASDSKTYDLQLKEENGRINIYRPVES